MRVLIAPNSYKNAANSVELAEAIQEGILKANPAFETRLLPIADGGDHSLDIILECFGGEKVIMDTTDPLGEPITAGYGIIHGNTAVIEVARASGLSAIKSGRLKPLEASTFGTGVLIKDALDRGCRKILLCLGGSASIDGGAGILQALGVELLDREGKDIPVGGGNLLLLTSINLNGLSSVYREVEFDCLYDVSNPLLGEKGAAVVYGPQKGASPLETMILDRCLAKFGSVCETYSGKDLINLEGSGASGGVAVGISSIFNTNLISGIDYILDILDAEKDLEWADVIITGEGILDEQSFEGKAPVRIAERARKIKAAKPKKIVCIAGKVPHRLEKSDKLFDAVFSLQNRPMTEKESMESTLVSVKNVAFEIASLLGD